MPRAYSQDLRWLTEIMGFKIDEVTDVEKDDLSLCGEIP